MHGQWSDGPLLASEELSIASVNAVHGYPERSIRVSKGAWASFEARSPEWKGFRAIAFTNAGYIADDLSEHDFIASAGLGIRGEITKHFQLRAELAFPLVDGDEPHRPPRRRGEVLIFPHSPTRTPRHAAMKAKKATPAAKKVAKKTSKPAASKALSKKPAPKAKTAAKKPVKRVAVKASKKIVKPAASKAVSKKVAPKPKAKGRGPTTSAATDHLIMVPPFMAMAEVQGHMSRAQAKEALLQWAQGKPQNFFGDTPSTFSTTRRATSTFRTQVAASSQQS